MSIDKDSQKAPILRFKGFTDDWEQRKLGDLGEVSMNKRIYKDQTTIEGEVPFVKIGTFGKKPDSFISRELFEEYKLKYPYPNIGDILISAAGSIGRTLEYNGEDVYFQDSNIVWLNHKGRLDNNFLKYFYMIVKWSGLEGSTIKRLYNKNILSTQINLPNIIEQEKIGTFLNCIENTIRLHQHKLDQLNQLKEALLQQMFPGKCETVPKLRFAGFEGAWEERKLGEISEMYQPQTITGHDLTESGYPVFGANGYIGYFSKYNHKSSQVTISARGEGTGTPSYVDGPVWITGNSMVINVEKNGINKMFLYTNLLSFSLKKYVTGGAQPQLVREVLTNVPIKIPSNEEQNKLGYFFGQLNANIINNKQKVSNLQSLQQVLLQNMFI